MPHGRHIYAKAYEMAKATMCAYSQSDNELPHRKCVLQCCDQFPSINITDQETYDKHPNPIPSIRFHIYHLISRCTKHGRLPLTDKKSCRKCQQDTASGKSTKIYTIKELVMIETNIYNFHTSFFIPEIHMLEFHISHVQILGTNHCGDSHWTSFKRRKQFQDVLFCRDYDERVVASFSNQIQSEYYGGNRSVSIEGIALEHFSALPQTEIKLSTKICPRHALFHSFFRMTANKILPLIPHTAIF